MDGHIDGDRESARRTRAEDADGRPIGSEAAPRRSPRDDPRHGPGLQPGLGTAPTGVPSSSIPPSTTMPGSEPGKAAAFGVLGALIILLGLIALPFFVFSLVIAAPIALVVLVIGAILLAARHRGPYSPSDR